MSKKMLTVPCSFLPLLLTYLQLSTTPYLVLWRPSGAILINGFEGRLLPLFTELPRRRVFSETLIQPCESLYVKSGAKGRCVSL
jgi:hypothetical protein